MKDEKKRRSVMAELGPWMITARNREHAEYLVRSRAEQRGVDVSRVDVSGGDGGMWLVSVIVTDSVEAGEAARLGDDTQVLHFDNHRARDVPPDGR
jgi:hypothetical protein